MHFDKILFMHRYVIQDVTNTHYFPDLFNRVLELCLRSISCEIIGGFDQIW